MKCNNCIELSDHVILYNFWNWSYKWIYLVMVLMDLGLSCGSIFQQISIPCDGLSYDCCFLEL